MLVLLGLYQRRKYRARETLAERWNGTGWSIQITSNPGAEAREFESP